MKRLRSLLPFVAIFLPGCVFDLGRFTVLSNQAVDLRGLELARADLQRGVEGSDGTFWILGVPVGGLPSLDRAVHEALRKGWGDVMLNCRVERVFWTTVLFSWTSYRVVGDVGASVGRGPRDLPARSSEAEASSPLAQALTPSAAAPRRPSLPPVGQPDPVEPLE